MSLDELRAKLDAQEAYLKNAQGNPDAALSLLAGKVGPDATIRALDILLEHNRPNDAVNWVKDREPEALWADRLIVALLRTGDDKRAEQTLEWSRTCGDPTVHDHCALQFAHALYSREIMSSRLLVPGELN